MVNIVQTTVDTASNTPEWLKLLGSGGIVGVVTGISGIVGGVVYFVINQRIEALKELNSSLTQQLTAATTAATLAQKQQKDFAEEAEKEVTKLFAIVERLQNSQLEDEDTAILRRIFKGLEQIRSSQAIFEEYKTSADWLKSQKKVWLEKGCKQAIRKQPNLLPFMGKKNFERDVSQYLEWVYTSLYYGHPRTPLNKFVRKPYVKSSFLYISALNSIKDLAVNDSGILSVRQVDYLEGMLEELLERIPNEFG